MQQSALFEKNFVALHLKFAVIKSSRIPSPMLTVAHKKYDRYIKLLYTVYTVISNYTPFKNTHSGLPNAGSHIDLYVKL